MSGDRTIREAFRANCVAERPVRAIVAAWRSLTGGSHVRDESRRTLIACSAGVDSTALSLALASASTNLVIAHVVHDMRVKEQSETDRAAAENLASRLGLPFASLSIRARELQGNYESNARRLRYLALIEIAKAHSCRFVATAHHADDQLETVLMRLLRGAGPRGLAGLARSRSLAPGVTLIRPMLSSCRDDAVNICRAAGVTWQEDPTNQDTTRLRSAIRLQLTPLIRRLAPGAARNVTSTSELLLEAATLIRREAQAVLELADRVPHELRWKRAQLQTIGPLILGEVVGLAAQLLTSGRGHDQLGHRVLRPALRAMKDHSTESRGFNLHTICILVDAHEVRIRARDGDARPLP